MEKLQIESFVKTLKGNTIVKYKREHKFVGNDSVREV